MTAVSAQALSKSYGQVRALEQMTLEIPRGAAFGLIGPNGAGKTTFIKLLLGIARPTSGEVRMLGQLPEDVKVRERVGYLPERLHLPGAWKPPAYLRSVATLKGLREAPVDALLSRVGLTHAAGRRISGFSKGMRQRLGLAAALLGSPDLLVLDEPTDGIDPLGRIEVRDLLLQEKARGATLLLNSHLLAETERVCDRIGILHEGKLRTSGTLESLKASARGWVLSFSEGSFEAARLAALGLEQVEGGRWRADAESPAALNALVDQARATGALLVRLEPARKDLEQLLKEALWIKAGQVAADLLREALWRKWFLGLFITITFVLVLLGFSLQLDVVDGAIAGSSLFGEVLFAEIRTASSALDPLFMATTLGAALGGALFLAVACSDFAPSLLSPGRIEHLLSLPVTRAQLLFGTWVGGLLVAIIATVYATFGLVLLLGAKTGVWNFKLLAGALIGVIVFATVYAAMMLAAVTVRSAAFSAAVGMGTVVLGVVSSNRAAIAKAIDPGVGRLVFEWAMVPVPKLGTLAIRAAFLSGTHAFDTSELWRLLGGAGLFSAGLLLVALFVFERKDF